MKELEQIVADARAAIAATRSIAELEQAKSRFLGKSGAVTELLKGLGKLSAQERPQAGAAINQAKEQVESLVASRRDAILSGELDAKLAGESIDVTLPGRGQSPGGLHPISRALEHVEELFRSMGFAVADGPEIENDRYNFTALRMFPNHPSRSMQDTFYVADSDNVLRTQTSPVQIRYMESHRPPVRIICPGRVYRHDHDATHSPMFHQIEGLWVDEGVSLADLKGTITQFCRAFFERDDIAVSVRDGVVTLAGYTKSYMDKWQAERVVSRIKGVRAVANDLEVKLATSSERPDPEIARAAVDALKWNVSVPADRIKVKVEKGWVTLEGDVDWYFQKEAAERTVRSLTGVRGVTNLITLTARPAAQDVKQKIKDALKGADMMVRASERRIQTLCSVNYL